jgi:glutamyl-tRNA synthetase
MSSNKPVRVRFAPSPTGFLHIGGIRSALFDWLWAKHNEGVFILRIEDTDRSRFVPDAINQIDASLELLGLAPDEGIRQGGSFGPYLQSERLDIYARQAARLVESGALYPCWCSAERLTKLREEAQAKGLAFKYDRHCLVPANQKSLDEPHVLRFRIPDSPESIAWDDAVRGRLEFKLADVDDFVAIKADGYPTYQFANVVDDHLMEISHVLRADEWIPSTPKHLLLFAAFDWEAPIYAHLPAVQGPSGGKKLSKRDGAKNVAEYIADGYLPEAINSFLATLGWNDGSTQEIYSSKELIERFSLKRIQKSPARFDADRLLHVNGVFIRGLSLPELLVRSTDFWPDSAKDSSDDYKLSILGLVQDRLKMLSELPELTDFFFADAKPSVELLTQQLPQDHASEALLSVLKALESVEWTHDALEAALRALAASTGIKTSNLFGLIRVAITSRTAAPGLFDTLVALGRDRSVKRIQAAYEQLSR